MEAIPGHEYLNADRHLTLIRGNGLPESGICVLIQIRAALAGPENIFVQTNDAVVFAEMAIASRRKTDDHTEA